jgi:hypothetical protein
MALAASALALELAWNPNSEADLAGYELSYGTSPGSYTKTVSTGSTPSATVTGLLPETTYYFSVRAVNSSGLKSAASAEISHRTAATDPSPNTAPVAIAASVSTAEDTAQTITLSATDADNQPLTYQVVTQPAKGTLSGSAPNLTYTPQADYSGSDSFTFRANDGSANSNTATVSITISPVNDAPVASAASATTEEDAPVSITLAATDKDSTSLTYQVVAHPAKGTLSGSAPNLTYTPQAGFSGSDSFTFRANDGSANSNTATVSISVTASGSPSLIDRTGWSLVSVDSEEPSTHPATAAFDGITTTFWHTRWKTTGTPPPHEIVISLGSAHSVSGFRYLPRQDGVLVGNISQFEFHTSLDGENWGSPAATGTFANTNSLKAIAFSPRNARFIRLRALGEANGSIHTAVAELDLLGGAPVNMAPVASAATVETDRNQSVSLILEAADADSDPLTYQIGLPPSSGTLTGTAPALIYTPDKGFTGTDTFTFTASDGIASSLPATITVEVLASGGRNLPPVFRSNPVIASRGEEGQGYVSSIATSASDPEGEAITFRKLGGPSWLTVSPEGILGGTPPAKSDGTHRFTIRATDATGASATALLVIGIDPSSLPPQWDGDAIGGKTAKVDIDFDDGAYRLRAAGRLSGRRDSGAFASQTLTGDGQIIARVTSMRNGGVNTRAGLMIRDSLNPGSRHVFIGLNGKGDSRFVRRTQAAPSQMKAISRDGKRHFWLKLVRSGTTITAFTSNDGKTWTEVGTTVADFGKNCHIGLYVAGGKGKTSTASFRNVRVNP